MDGITAKSSYILLVDASKHPELIEHSFALLIRTKVNDLDADDSVVYREDLGDEWTREGLEAVMKSKTVAPAIQ